MNCQQFREMIDSYIGDELLVETNHDVLHHLENCPACRGELSARRQLRARLHSAVRNAPQMQMNPAFAAALRNNLRETALLPKWWEIKDNAFLNMKILTAAAICLLVIAGLGIFLSKYRNSPSKEISVAENQSNDSGKLNNSNGDVQFSGSPASQAAQIAWREITHFAVGDHKNCALKFRLKEKPISLDEAAKKYGKFNKDLDKAVIKPLQEIFPAKISGKIKLIEAHSCVFDGRRFSHIVLQHQNHVISVLITDADLPDKDGDAIVNQAAGNFQVASFHTKHHAVFIVSDLSAAENLIIAQTVIPAVSRHLEKFEV